MKQLLEIRLHTQTKHYTAHQILQIITEKKFSTNMENIVVYYKFSAFQISLLSSNDDSCAHREKYIKLEDKFYQQILWLETLQKQKMQN